MLMKTTLCLEHLPNFIFYGVIPKLLPEGQYIICDLERIRFVRLHFTNRIVAEIIDQYTLYACGSYVR